MTALPPQPQHALSADDILAGLDPDQRAVATELDGPMRVLAGAGTGKTRAITHRIAYGIAIGRYQGPRVLALTFTLRAAEEMRTRLQQLGAFGVQARTFHSAALRQLTYFWPQVVGGTFPSIVQNKAALITEAANRLRISTDRSLLRDLASLIEWAKVQLLTPDTLMQRLSEKQLPSAITPQNMQRIFQAYEDLKDERNLIDFEDVLLLTIAMLEEDEKLAATVRQQYRHFVVDEYQDVSPLQQRLLDVWLGGRDDICVVGDASQTIYSFTGATSRYLLEFPRRYRGAHTVKLTRDYRSHSQVVELANRLLAARRPHPDSSPHSWAPPLELMSQRGPGVDVEWFGYADDEQEAAGIAEDIRDLIDKEGVASSARTPSRRRLSRHCPPPTSRTSCAVRSASSNAPRSSRPCSPCAAQPSPPTAPKTSPATPAMCSAASATRRRAPSREAPPARSGNPSPHSCTWST